MTFVQCRVGQARFELQLSETGIQRSQVLVVIQQVAFGDDAVAGVVEDSQSIIDAIDLQRHCAVTLATVELRGGVTTREVS